MDGTGKREGAEGEGEGSADALTAGPETTTRGAITLATEEIEAIAAFLGG